MESKGKVGGASRELEETAAPKDPEEAEATTAEEEDAQPKADLGGERGDTGHASLEKHPSVN